MIHLSVMTEIRNQEMDVILNVLLNLTLIVQKQLQLHLIFEKRYVGMENYSISNEMMGI